MSESDVSGIHFRWTDRHSWVVPAMPRVPAVDLSPLANLATAVAWGLALERVVTEWRAWHPAARVTWDIIATLNPLTACTQSLRLAFAIDGLGQVDGFTCYLTSHPSIMDGIVDEVKQAAALAMAPHYVAPKRGGR